MVSLSRVLQEMKCPVPGCLSVAHSAQRIHKHFMYRYFLSKVEVIQEGVEPLPHCDLCRMHMAVRRLIRNQRTACCDKNTQMRWQRRDAAISSRCLGGKV